MTKKEMEEKIEGLSQTIESLIQSIYTNGSYEYRMGRAMVKRASNVTLQELAAYVLDGDPIVRCEKRIVYGKEPEPNHAKSHEQE